MNNKMEEEKKEIAILVEGDLYEGLKKLDENKGKFDIIAAFGMMELADQELSGRQPVKVEKDDAQFEDFGYWKDEKGIKHYGVIPKKQKIEYKLKVENEDDTYRFETSDTRLYQAVIQNGVHR